MSKVFNHPDNRSLDIAVGLTLDTLEERIGTTPINFYDEFSRIEAEGKKIANNYDESKARSCAFELLGLLTFSRMQSDNRI